MAERDYIRFLGTAGARFAVARQLRHSGGTLVRIGGRSIMLDPGPGTLALCASSRPRIDVAALDAVVLTHAHIDHSNDTSVLLDAMTRGGWTRRGALFAPKDCLQGPNRVVMSYLRDFPERIVPIEPRTRYALDGVAFSTSVRHRHGVETYGIRFHGPRGDIAFCVDTGWFDGLPDCYADADTLVINVVLRERHPTGRILHLGADEAETLIGEARPRRAVLTHFGTPMLDAGPDEVARDMAGRLGIEVVAARDDMILDLDCAPPDGGAP